MQEPAWKYVSATPSKIVQSWGCAFGGFSERTARPVERLEVPAAAAVIVLTCGEPVTLQAALSPGDSTRASAFSAGHQVPAQRVSHSGINDCIEIRLPPLAAYALFGGAMAESNHQPLNLLDAEPRRIGMLMDQLQTPDPWERRLAAVDRFLSRGFADSTRRIPPELVWAWEILTLTHGQVSIAALTQTIGWSERHLINQFRTYFGVAPKATARRLRFSHALDLVSREPAGDLCAIAMQAGFSDQSHMTREFQDFAGVTPGVLRTARFDDLPGIPAAVLLRR